MRKEAREVGDKHVVEMGVWRRRRRVFYDPTPRLVGDIVSTFSTASRLVVSAAMVVVANYQTQYLPIRTILYNNYNN